MTIFAIVCVAVVLLISFGALALAVKCMAGAAKTLTRR